MVLADVCLLLFVILLLESSAFEVRGMWGTKTSVAYREGLVGRSYPPMPCVWAGEPY